MKVGHQLQYIYETAKIILKDESDELIGEIYFPAIRENIVLLEHVFVRVEHEQEGFASALVAKFVKYATEHKLQVKVLDPFAKLMFAQHPEYQSLLVTE